MVSGQTADFDGWLGPGDVMGYGLFRAHASFLPSFLSNSPSEDTFALWLSLELFFLHFLFCSLFQLDSSTSPYWPEDFGPSWVIYEWVGCCGCRGHTLPLGLECIFSVSGGGGRKVRSSTLTHTHINQALT